MRALLLATLVLAVASCAAPEGRLSLAAMEAESAGRGLPDLVAGHQEAARAGAEGARQEPLQPPQLAAMTQQVEKVRKGLDELLKNPAKAATFRAFDTEEMRRLRKLATEPASLKTALEDGLTLAELEAFVFARDPRIAAAFRDLRSAVERYPQVVYVEVLLSQYTTFLADLALGAGPPLQKDPVALKFPIPGVLSLKTDLVTREVELAREKYARVVRDRIVTAHETFFGLGYVLEALRINREVLGYLEQLERTVSSRLEAGRAEKSQVLQVQVEISSLEDDIITLEEQEKTLKARLRELLDLEPAASIAKPVRPEREPSGVLVEKPLYAKAHAARQEITIARLKVRRVETAIELAEKMTYPDWTLGLGYFRGIRPVDRRKPPKGVTPEGFTARPPQAKTFWFGQREAYLREVREMRTALLKALEGERRSAEFLVRKEFFALDEARRRLKLYRDVLITQARQAYEDTLAAYDSDRVDFFNVIDTLRQWLRFDLERDRARRDDFIAFIRLEAAVGTALAGR